MLNEMYNDIKEYITRNNEIEISIPNIFIKLFYFSCIKNKKDCIEYLINIYINDMDTVTKVGLRQSFYYGKYLIKDKKLYNWYDENILSLIKLY